MFAFATHGLFNGPAPERINDSALEECIVSNTIPLSVEVALRCKKIKTLSVGKLLSETIRRVHCGLSLSDMFDAVQAGSMCFASAPLPRPGASIRRESGTCAEDMYRERTDSVMSQGNLSVDLTRQVSAAIPPQ